MNEERTGKCLGQVEHIRGHLGHRYSIMANQAMVAIVKQFVESDVKHHKPNLTMNLYTSFYIFQ
jgi:hypothetical protein